MAASKSGFMKDALILFAITLISGVCLGFVYDITKAPIERATIEANNRTYKEVLSTAAEFSEVGGLCRKDRCPDRKRRAGGTGLRQRCHRVRP